MTDWIKISERLPDIDQEVIIISENLPFAATFKKDTYRRLLGKMEELSFRVHETGCGCCSETIKPEEVTYWMPILEYPKESKS